MTESDPPAGSKTAWSKVTEWLDKLRPSRWSEGRFRTVIVLALLVLSVTGVYGLRSGRQAVLPMFEFFRDNLPLALPILTVVLSIMLRPDSLTKLDGWLNFCNHFARGLVSFAIWAFVAGQGVQQYIRINPTTVLNKDHSLLLVFGAFIWAGFCSVVSAMASIGEEVQHRKWRIGQAVLVALSLVGLLMPYFLFEKKEAVEKRLGVSFDERQFTVSIPYRDPALNKHLGRSTDPLTQCAVYRSVTARTPREARLSALKQFRASDDALQFSPNGRASEGAPRRQVEVLENLIVAAPEGSDG